MGKYSLFDLSPISIKKKTANLFDLLFFEILCYSLYLVVLARQTGSYQFVNLNKYPLGS